MRKKLICLLLVFTTVIGCAPTNDTPSSSSINISDLINSSSESIVKHSVTFMDGKEVVSVIEVEHNKIITDLPSVPSKDGYTSEWDYDFRPIIEDTIIYLRNDLNTYQIYYYSEYGDVNPLNKLTYTYEDENITLYAPVNSEGEGKYFLGWYTTPDYENGTKITHIGSGSYGDITLYAKWISCVVEKAEGFTIDYNTDSLPTLYMVVQNSSSIVTLSSLITVSSNCSWSLSTDIEGLNEIKTRNVSLKNVGHNYYYLTVWYDDNYNLVYLVDIYKLDMFAYSFVSNGEVLKEENIEENSLISKIEDPSKIGYTFTGWSIDGENLVEFPYKATSSVSFNAVFVPNKYSISLDYDNNIDESQTIDVYYDQSVSLPNPEKYGHTFIGWEDINTHKIIDNSFIYNYESSISLKAVYKPNNYIIYVDTDNDGEYDNSYDVTFGEEYTIDSPSSDGHTFTGWTDKDGNVVDSNYTHLIDNDLYISANWDIINYAIKYNLNGGTNSSKNPNSYTYNDKIVFDEATKVGYAFKGWYIDSNFNTQITGIDVGSIGNKELYAKFVPNQYSLVVKDLDNKTISSSNVYYDSTFTVPEAISKTGYTFKGWQDQNGNQYTPNAEIIWNFTENITLTPIFEINKYNVVVDIDDLEAVVVQGDGTYEYNQDITLSVTINDGYIFLGWYDENDKFISRDKTLSINKIDKEYKYYVKTYKLDENGCYIYDGVKYKINDNDISVVGYVEGITTANILEEFINKKVTSIESNAFYGCSTLTSITIPSSVTEIGDNVFFWCDSLINVYYEGTIEGWCQIVFNDVFSNPMYIASHFYMLDKNNDYKELTEIIIPNTITSIGAYQFYGFNNVTSITIPNSVTSIGSSAFGSCSSLISITIPSSVTSIEKNAFDGCSSLINVTIPNSVTSIGYRAFVGCNSLATITLPFIGGSKESNQYLGYIFGASSYSSNSSYVPSSLKEVIILEGCTSIGSNAFYGCSSLTSITIPNSVTEIGEYAFYACGYLTNVYYKGTIENWCHIEFNNYYSNPMYYASHFYMLNENNKYKELTEIIIPNTITSIGDYQFYGFNNVTSIIIPSSVTSIGSSAFCDCNSLKTITIPFIGENKESNQYLGYIFGAISSDYNSSYIPRSLQEVIILEGCTSIEYCAFDGCSSLTSITIPSSVTSIGSSAFSRCSSLTSITIPNSVKSIGGNAFKGCSSLTSITIPSSVTEIGSNAFCDCNSLKTITLPFIGGSKESNQYLGYIFGASSYSSNSSYVPSSLKEVIILEGCTSIGSNAFYGCTSLERIIISSSVTSIGNNVFESCSSLKSVIFENNSQLTSIGKYAFRGCSSLISITIPSRVTSIGSSAFEDCSSLINVYYKGTIENWCHIEFNSPSENPMYYASNFYMLNENNEYKELTEIVIPNTVTSIGRYQFYNFNNVISITISRSVISIGNNAFGNSSLTTVYYKGTIEDWCNIEFYSAASNPMCIASDFYMLDKNNEYKELTEIVIPNTVTSIGYYQFYGFNNVTSITIPSSVTSIEYCAFSGCSSLQYNQYNNGLYLGNSENPYLVLVKAKDKEITYCTINENTIVILNSAFSGCNYLTSITISSSVTSIGSSAFYGCSSLTIYCEVSSKPSGWNDYWNYSDRPVYWGVEGE